MTIIFAIVAALAIVAFGVVLMLYLNERRYHAYALSTRHHLRLKVSKEKNKREALEKEITVLRDSNRSANKAWQSERRRLFAQARAAERHASEQQEFHLYNQRDLEHELASAYALIELLFDKIPKNVEIKFGRFETQRVFRPIIETFSHPRMQADPALDMPSLDRYKTIF
jgi:hypothetical protein